MMTKGAFFGTRALGISAVFFPRFPRVIPIDNSSNLGVLPSNIADTAYKKRFYYATTRGEDPYVIRQEITPSRDKKKKK